MLHDLMNNHFNKSLPQISQKILANEAVIMYYFNS